MEETKKSHPDLNEDNDQKEPTKFNLFLRKMLRWSTAVLAIFVLGIILTWIIQVSPRIKEVSEIEKPPPTMHEEDFYEPFANWLKDELGECSEAIALGGNYLSKKWGTPDVIGIYKSLSRDVIKFNPEIISAEIKINPSDPITAFGQAIAYRLFSSKVYLVEPNTMLPEDLDRIEALCILFGVGLILFDLNPEKPNFIIRVRAQRYSPDMFYVNEFADKLYNARRNIFDKLF